ncbi:MAG: 30S ribosomal protein S12 methylthiotransferase RimO [Anaerolineae bacterium]
MSGSRSFYLISLGCPKNLVDSEGIATLLRRAGYTPAPDPDTAELLIVNTCGFIESARQESRTVLQELAQSKQPHQRIIAAGCYSQRCPDKLAKAVPEIDGLMGTRRWMDIVEVAERLDGRGGQLRSSKPLYHVPDVGTVGQDTHGVVRAAVQGSSAYLKLADGCRRACAFCAIPLIKGPTVSRSPEAILADAGRLADLGVREIILIAQDTTDYGRDLRMEHGLAELLDQLVATVPQVPWIRLMYTYPSRTGLTQRLIETMASHRQILPYLDLPLQHAHPGVLRRMRRPARTDRVRQMIDQLREVMPEIAIRTTFLVGYPGETEEEFRTLLQFVDEMQFDRVGVFTYSHEEGTWAAELEDDIPPEVKTERRDRLLAAQQPISHAKNQALVGEVLDVLIEGQDEGLSVGRSYRDAPEVDGLVLIEEELPVGEIVPIRVTAALEYDLLGQSP